jgi:hypothetical protein
MVSKIWIKNKNLKKNKHSRFWSWVRWIQSTLIHFPLFKVIPRIQQSPRPHAAFHNMLISCGEKVLTRAQLASWRTTPCWLSVTSYSHICSNLPYLEGVSSWGRAMLQWQGTNITETDFCSQNEA